MPNIFTYGFSLRGKLHKERNLCCQDSHKIVKYGNIYIAAVADGVGSAENSQIGSNIAVNTAVDFCCENFEQYESDPQLLIKLAYEKALKRIFEEPENNNKPVDSYDTTLTLAVYDGQKIAFGHSGDGAIIGLTNSGDFIEITKPQKGADNISVIPLRAGTPFWQIDFSNQDFAALLLLTDGMLNTLCPYLLKLDKEKSDIYIPLASYFADLKSIVEKNPADSEEIKKKIEEFVTAESDYNCDNFYEYLTEIYRQHLSEQQTNELIAAIKINNFPIKLMQQEQDDKTVVALINTEIKIGNKSIDFYAEPNWMKLSDLWRRKAYPHLYKENIAEEKTPTSNEISKISENKTETIVEPRSKTKKKYLKLKGGKRKCKKHKHK